MVSQLNLYGENVDQYFYGNENKLRNDDMAFHNWYRFVLSFPPHLVRKYIQKFKLNEENILLDPFCGTGTTIIEAKLNGIRGIGIEFNPMSYFSSKVKTDWDIDWKSLQDSSIEIANNAKIKIKENGNNNLQRLSRQQQSLLITNSISPIPLHKSLILLSEIQQSENSDLNHQLLAFASSTVKYASNLRFGPEVGVSKRIKNDADVVNAWLREISIIIKDLKVQEHKNKIETQIIKADARDIGDILSNNSIDAVFTSPPYPNEKDYTRTTRLESVLLGFIKNKDELRELKRGLLRSNTRNVYKGDDDDKFIKEHSEILEIADEIEKRRIHMGKTSGFEKTYHKVTKLYFGGIARHLESLKSKLKKGAKLGYVVGDQASYLQVYIPTGKIIANIAEKLGYKIIGIDPFRTRYATSTKREMNEEVVLLKWE
jgi:DNA modification methylase